jgi:DNA-binding MarR family transcriptional regulator
MIQVMNDCVSFESGLSVPAACQTRLGLLLARVGGALLDVADDRLAEAGVGGREYTTLAVLSDDEPRSQLELAQMLGKAPALMVAVIDDLEGRGLVERTRDPADRRRSRVTLTAAGRRTLKRADTLADAIVAELLPGLSADDRQQLHRLLLGGVRVEAEVGAAAS